MIILSGVLVVVAIALLIAGIVAGNAGTDVLGLDGLNLIYISIGVSIVSALFLLIGVILRRKELFGPPATSSSRPAARAAKHSKRDRGGRAAQTKVLPGADSGQSAETGATSDQPDRSSIGRTPDPDAAEPEMPPPADVPPAAVVYVVPGRRHYHIGSCRQLAGRGKEQLTFEEARGEGFSPCTACMPDTALAARAVTGGLGTDATDAQSMGGERTETGSDAESFPAGERDAPVEAFGSNGTPTFSAAVQRSAIDDLAADAPGAERVGTGDDRQEAGDFASDQPNQWSQRPGTENAKSADTDDPANATDSAGGSASGAGGAGVRNRGPSVGDGLQVRILSGTKRYHRPDCALIEDIGDEADDLESLTRAEAKARGCTPCLVCQPDKEPVSRD